VFKKAILLFLFSFLFGAYVKEFLPSADFYAGEEFVEVSFFGQVISANTSIDLVVGGIGGYASIEYNIPNIASLNVEWRDGRSYGISNIEMINGKTITDFPGSRAYITIPNYSASDIYITGNILTRRIPSIENMWEQFTVAEELVASINVSDSYSNVGDPVNMQGYTRAGIYVDYTPNDSLTLNIKIVGLSSLDSGEYELYGVRTRQIDDTGHSKIYFEFDIGTLPYIQIKTKVDSLGSSPGELTVNISKKWRN
jgi:hypothetical protein